MWKLLAVFLLGYFSWNLEALTTTTTTTPPPSNCRQLPDPGMCDAYFRNYFYNTTSNTCQEFIYGGCGGNGNNYKTVHDCHQSCICSQPKKVGPCRAAMLRYFYNSATKKCEKFSWGGCQPNLNNFKTLKECDKICGKDCKK